MASDQELARRELERRQQEEADFFSRFANVPALEEVLAIGTGALAEPLSGLGALFATPFVGSQRAAEMVGEFQDDLTYQPRGARANANLQAVGEFLAPVGEAMDWAAENAGEGVYNLTGSPAAAAFTEGLIQAAPDIAGLRFGGRMIDNMGDVGGQATGMGRREGGAVGVPFGRKRLYRGLEQEFDPDFDTTRSDAPTGYSTWTDNPELARQYAGDEGFVYYVDLPESMQGVDVMNNDGDRVLFFNNEKPAGLNNITGDEYLLYLDHDDYSPSGIKLFNDR